MSLINSNIPSGMNPQVSITHSSPTDKSVIDIPDGFRVSPTPMPRTAKGRWTWLVTQEYETFDAANPVGEEGAREFLSLQKMAACVLPVCPNEKKYLLIRQFRYPAYHNTSTPILNTFVDGSPEEAGWLYEAIAGVIELNDSPESTVIREAQEEGSVALDPSAMKLVHHCFMTPGLTNEEMYVYVAVVDSTGPVGPNGLANESELIRAKWLTSKEIKKLHKDGMIRDAKTIIALYAARVL